MALNFPQTSIEAEETQPRVVAVNGRGEERILFIKSTWEEAVEARGRVHDDLVRMNPV